MARFIQLTSVAHGPFDLRADKLDGIIPAGDGGHTTIAFAGMQIAVTESRAEILALLTEPVGEVTVTDEAVEAAARVYAKATGNGKPVWFPNMRAAIEAADRARGLRP